VESEVGCSLFFIISANYADLISYAWQSCSVNSSRAPTTQSLESLIARKHGQRWSWMVDSRYAMASQSCQCLWSCGQDLWESHACSAFLRLVVLSRSES